MVRMKMFGIMSAPQPKQSQQSQQPQQQSATANANRGRPYNMKNLGSIMTMKSTGCKSCGG